MKTIHENPTRTCSLCHRTLPADHFYIINKRTGKHDAYCKTCRRQQNYLHQHPDEALAPTEKATARPNIFTETDPQRQEADGRPETDAEIFRGFPDEDGQFPCTGGRDCHYFHFC